MTLDLGMKNVFLAISFEYIGELDSYFTYRYITIKYTSGSIKDKLPDYYQSYGPRSAYENGFWAISFEYIGVLDSYFIHRYRIIKYR